GSISVVHEKQTGRGVAGHIDVLPSVFIEIRRNDGHAVSRRSSRDAGLLCHVGERSVAIVPIESVLAGCQPPRSAFDRNSFPAAIGVIAGRQCILKRKTNVVRNEEIKMSITVVIHEGASGSESLLVVPKAGGFRYIGEGSISVVTVQSVLSESGAKNVFKAVVIVIADTNPRSPLGSVQPSFFGYV